MVVATSSEVDFVSVALRRLGIAPYFQKIFSCSELRTSKGEPKIYEEAAKLLGTANEDTYVFEDALHAVETAKRAGFVTVGAYDHASKEHWEKIQEEATFSFVSLEDFKI